uniref:(California timema) hypothetical protein n=1 Tax=Timema californicum TaxID=61474 RepID=A0A7R9JAE0_TIMCA|nr:unnamed protein product [Timema californicum]
MRLFWRYFSIIFAIVYILLCVLSIYSYYLRKNASSEPVKEPQYLPPFVHKQKKWNYSRLINHKFKSNCCTVEIWGKASIGVYLWKHILNGETEKLQGGLVYYGNKTIDDILFHFRFGPGIIQSTVPSDVEFVVLVLNGRSKDKIAISKVWLDYLPLYKKLRGAIVLLLGDERCDNNWLLPYMKSRGGILNAAFMVYDSTLVDNIEFYQWPLGVAAYRKFPHVLPEQVDTTSSRSHVCNFLGTLYENSSRHVLMSVIRTWGLEEDCIVLGRMKWQPLETRETLETYIKALLNSDLTLSPVGMNTECYRIYEAMSLGSVPVVEEVVTPGHCDHNAFNSPLRLLKEYGAPVYYIKDWRGLPTLIQHDAQLTLEEKIERRISVIQWYKGFKDTMKRKFVGVVKNNFFIDGPLFT